MSAQRTDSWARRFIPPLSLLAVAICTLVTFFPAVHLGFLDWDDDRNFVNNVGFRGLYWHNLKWMFSTFQTGPYQPLSWVTLGLDYIVWQLNPFGYHLTNLIIHAVSAALLVAVVFRLARLRVPESQTPNFKPLLLGAVVGLLWAIHPLRTEPVAWVTERRELLCGLLTLAALLHDLGDARRVVTVLLGCAAMLAKATAVVLPVMLVALDFYRDPRYPAALSPPLLFPALRRRFPLIVAAVAICTLAIYGQREAHTAASLESIALGPRIVLYFNAVAFYPAKTLWPAGLTAFYPIPLVCDPTLRTDVHPLIPTAAIAAMIVACSLFFAIRRRVQHPWLLPLIVVYLATIAPIGGLVQVGGQFAADRYAYQPTWIVTLAAVLTIRCLIQRPSMENRAALAAIPIAIGLALISRQQLSYWKSNISLWKREIEVFPDCALAHFNLANAYSDLRADPAVVAEAEQHFRLAVKSLPCYTEAWSGLGDLFAVTNRREAAIDHYHAALQTRPTHLPAIRGLADSLWTLNRKPEALDALRMLARYDPKNEYAWLSLAKALANAGQTDESISVLETAHAENPAAPLLRRQLIWLLSTHPDAAVRNGKRAVALVESAPPPTGWPDILAAAAAFAEIGNYARAAKSLDDAAATLDSRQAEALRQVADQFRRGEPLRVPPQYP